MPTPDNQDHDEADFRRLGGPVPTDAAGERVDGYLARQFPFLSRSGWQKRLEQATLLVNGRSIKSAARLKNGDILTMIAPQECRARGDRGIRVLWQEADVMAVFKPGNLPMHENGPYRKNTFTEIVWQELGREWSAVHRLDRETSGIVLCGANAEVRGRLARDLALRKVRKEYLAIARGYSCRGALACRGSDRRSRRQRHPHQEMGRRGRPRGCHRLLTRRCWTYGLPLRSPSQDRSH